MDMYMSRGPERERETEVGRAASQGEGRFPTNNTVESNLVDTLGIYGKQTSAYFKAKAKAKADPEGGFRRRGTKKTKLRVRDPW